MSQPLRILLVDDDQMVRSIFQEFLSSLNHSVIEASNARQAIDLFNDLGHTIDVIITDICMPMMNGVSLIRHVRQSHADLPIAVISGYADDESLDAAHQLGARIYHKPLNFSELIQFLDSLPGREESQPASC